MAAFEIIEHPADVGFRATGASFRELLENSAAALLSLMCDVAGVEERASREIVATGGDRESLLFAWLAEILAVADAEGLFFHRAIVTDLTEGRVHGIAYGEPIDKARHRRGTAIKAVTYHQLAVEESAEGWRATVFVDV